MLLKNNDNVVQSGGRQFDEITTANQKYFRNICNQKFITNKLFLANMFVCLFVCLVLKSFLFSSFISIFLFVQILTRVWLIQLNGTHVHTRSVRLHTFYSFIHWKVSAGLRNNKRCYLKHLYVSLSCCCCMLVEL